MISSVISGYTRITTHDSPLITKTLDHSDLSDLSDQCLSDQWSKIIDLVTACL